jgi:hypothetical protein
MDIAAEEIPEQEEVIPETTIEVNSEPTIVSKTMDTIEVEPETIEISGKEKILPHVEPQKIKYNRFRFKNDNNKSKLINTIQNIKGNITVIIDDKETESQNKPDIILKENGEVIGKINLLLCDRRDANLPEKYYIKLYFREFKDQGFYDKIKETLVNFFENFQHVNNQSRPPTSGGNRKKRRNPIRTHKKRKMEKRKKTSKRKHRH